MMVFSVLHLRSRLLLPASVITFCLLALIFRSNQRTVTRRYFGSQAPLDKENSEAASSPPPGQSTAVPSITFQAEVPKDLGQNYTRTLVVASTSKEDTTWVSYLAGEASFSSDFYEVENAQASFTVPKNKGHEVMVYLTYIIDNYHRLSDVTMFMHAHRVTWHNNDLMFSDAVEMVQRLSSAKVTRDGYMNMRCHLDPGCPDHIHPSTDDDHNGNVPEAVVIGRAWLELFPDANAPPAVLSQLCCAQFALSKGRILDLPLKRYELFRDWLLKTDLDDRLSGRVWEYVWQFIFAGVEEFCPVESICYCDGYGICFGGEDQYQAWFAMRKKSRELADVKTSLPDDESAEKEKLQIQVELTELDVNMTRSKKEAFSRGADPKNRALEAGRAWKEGDGF